MLGCKTEYEWLLPQLLSVWESTKEMSALLFTLQSQEVWRDTCRSAEELAEMGIKHSALATTLTPRENEWTFSF